MAAPPRIGLRAPGVRQRREVPWGMDLTAAWCFRTAHGTFGDSCETRPGNSSMRTLTLARQILAMTDHDRRQASPFRLRRRPFPPVRSVLEWAYSCSDETIWQRRSYSVMLIEFL